MTIQRQPTTEESLSSWQRFKRWLSHSFGCTSPQNGEDKVDNNKRPVKRRANSKRDSKKESKDQEKSQQSNTDRPKVKRSQSFSKDADKMPYIDESTIDIPEGVKKEEESSKM